ncbi:MAG: DUF4159 domain-containing protein [Phycisphaeraceae bacterium]
MNTFKLPVALSLLLVVAGLLAAQPSPTAVPKSDAPKSDAPKKDASAGTGKSLEPHQSGGESESVVQVANLVYAGTKSSKCFSDHFLVEAEKVSSISTSRRFHAVKLASDELFEFPMVIMTGEGEFTLPDAERQNLRKYLERGGFLLASAGCSSPDWDRSFRAEMAKIFPEHNLADLAMDHPVFHTVTDIKDIQTKHGKPKPLEGISLRGRLCVLYSNDGLNDTAHSQGCCCCGGNEIYNCVQINVNILAYALTY